MTIKSDPHEYARRQKERTLEMIKSQPKKIPEFPRDQKPTSIPICIARQFWKNFVISDLETGETLYRCSDSCDAIKYIGCSFTALYGALNKRRGRMKRFGLLVKAEKAVEYE
jgi:hypothetical protein